MNRVRILLPTCLLLAGAALAQEQQTPINIQTNRTKPENAELTINYPGSPCVVKANTTDPSFTDVYNASGTAAPRRIAKEWASYKVVADPANNLNPLCGATVTVGSDTYNLVQFHFHTPSEHTVNGQRPPVEVHFVHLKSTFVADATHCKPDLVPTGTRPILVVGAFLVPGRGGDFDRLFNFNPSEVNPSNGLPVQTTIDLSALLPKRSSYWHYDGGLTAPNTDCNWNEGNKVDQLVTGVFPEAVNWYLMQEPVNLGNGAIEKMRVLFPEGNARSLKTVGERTVFSSRGR